MHQLHGKQGGGVISVTWEAGMGGRCRDLMRWEGAVCRHCGLVDGIVSEVSLYMYQCFVFS